LDFAFGSSPSRNSIVIERLFGLNVTFLTAPGSVRTCDWTCEYAHFFSFLSSPMIVWLAR
jgi:hypothetical protein